MPESISVVMNYLASSVDLDFILEIIKLPLFVIDFCQHMVECVEAVGLWFDNVRQLKLSNVTFHLSPRSLMVHPNNRRDYAWMRNKLFMITMQKLCWKFMKI